MGLPLPGIDDIVKERDEMLLLMGLTMDQGNRQRIFSRVYQAKPEIGFYGLSGISRHGKGLA
jgi:hypothetical protein